MTLIYERSGWDYVTWVVVGLVALGVAILCGFNAFYWNKIKNEDTSKEISSTTSNTLFIANFIFSILGATVVIWIIIIFIVNPKGKLVQNNDKNTQKN